MHFNLNFALSSQYRSCVFIEFFISQECFFTCNVFLLLHLSYDSILSTHCVCFSSQPEHCNVCFWYTPPSVRCLPHGPDRDRRLHQVSAQPQVIGSTRRCCVSPEHSVCVCAGGSSDQSQDDGERLRHDWLSASGSQSQLLPLCAVQSCHTTRGHRLPLGRDCQTGPWPLTSTVFQLSGQIVFED